MNFASCQSRTTNPHSHVPHRLDLPTEPATHPRCPNRVRISARTGAPGQRTSTNVPARNRTELADATLAGPSCDALRHPIVLRQRCLGAAATRPHCFWRALFSAPPGRRRNVGGLCRFRVFVVHGWHFFRPLWEAAGLGVCGGWDSPARKRGLLRLQDASFRGRGGAV